MSEVRTIELLTIFPEAKPYVEKQLKKDRRTIIKANVALHNCVQAIEMKASGTIKTVLLDFISTAFEYDIAPIKQRITRANLMLMAVNEKTAGFVKRKAQNVELARYAKINDVLRSCGIKTGKGNIACPIHDDKTPSFSIYKNKDGKEKYKCFGCGASGDAISLTMTLRGCTFNQAVEYCTKI